MARSGDRGPAEDAQGAKSRCGRPPLGAHALSLGAVAEELAEVRAALRSGADFLGMSGGLLREYAAELAKKEELLRLAARRALPGGAGRPRHPGCAAAPAGGARRAASLPLRHRGGRQGRLQSDRAQHLKSMHFVKQAKFAWARVLSQHGRDEAQRMVSESHAISRTVLRLARVRLGIARMALFGLYIAKELHCSSIYLLTGGSPQWRGAGMVASTMDLISCDGERWTCLRVLLPAVRIGGRQPDLIGKTLAILWKIMLIRMREYLGHRPGDDSHEAGEAFDKSGDPRGGDPGNAASAAHGEAHAGDNQFRGLTESRELTVEILGGALRQRDYFSADGDGRIDVLAVAAVSAHPSTFAIFGGDVAERSQINGRRARAPRVDGCIGPRDKKAPLSDPKIPVLLLIGALVALLERPVTGALQMAAAGWRAHPRAGKCARVQREFEASGDDYIADATLMAAPSEPVPEGAPAAIAGIGGDDGDGEPPADPPPPIAAEAPPEVHANGGHGGHAVPARAPISLEAHWRGGRGLRAQCPTRHGCNKRKSSAMGAAEFGPAAAKHYLSTWLAAAPTMGAAEHRAWKPSQDLAAVLRAMEAHPHDERAQRAGVHAVGRLARDVQQLRPQCLAAVALVGRAAARFPDSLALQRLAVAALGSISYVPGVASLIAHEALPAIFAAMVGQSSDSKLQGLGCEALARLAQVGDQQVVQDCIQILLGHPDRRAVEVCCVALRRLCDSGICQAGHVLDALAQLSESQPENLEAQHRAGLAIGQLVENGSIGHDLAHTRAPALVCREWASLLTRFVGADAEEAELNGAYHAKVQSMFHEEVARRFEYEATERLLHLSRGNASGAACLREVVRCLVENLEDYKVRLEARDLAWDGAAQRLVPLDAPLRGRLCADVADVLEAGLLSSLKAAAALGNAPHDDHKLMRRRSFLRRECDSLLDKKTEVTQALQERMVELSREVMLCEGLEYLEMRASRARPSQLHTFRHMLEVAEPVVPPQLLAQLRERLDRLLASVTEHPRHRPKIFGV
ncbi:unnamed protein product [Prorocentrum cordatum]|uniref:Tubulin-specific chaperone D n=1 Tax=Prorocentrum cordatum TaxID=2364126 RepID=A0ABN9VGZ1_9DINO|nr:unnamed protein product [Polarella glacialis]